MTYPLEAAAHSLFYFSSTRASLGHLLNNCNPVNLCLSSAPERIQNKRLPIPTISTEVPPSGEVAEHSG